MYLNGSPKLVQRIRKLAKKYHIELADIPSDVYVIGMRPVSLTDPLSPQLDVLLHIDKEDSDGWTKYDLQALEKQDQVYLEHADISAVSIDTVAHDELKYWFMLHYREYLSEASLEAIQRDVNRDREDSIAYYVSLEAL
jgi:hypothetical protein